MAVAIPAQGQLRRDALVQPVGDTRSGEALIGAGVSRTANADFPLAGLGGDLTAFPELHAAWAVGPRIVFELKGAARKTLSIERRDSVSSVDLDPSLAGGTSRDVGDFELAVSFAPIGRATGFSAGGHLGVKLPNSDETRGIGLNTTDITIAALVSWGSARWRATGWFGVGILEAPIDVFEQNDAFAYAFEGQWDATPNWRLSVGTRGRASTRRVSPLGTGDLGEVRATVEWRRRPLAIDVGLGHGTTPLSGDWNLRAGVAWTLAGNRQAAHPPPTGTRRHHPREETS
ncbi:MAG: hypothetical protein OXI39_12675 [Gemmatimonadota bacterium]|uniref:hypothetical protein n=1 Tax=Candidatus Palauibacter scopulicola TaxID=3056741 RepID=UPI00239C22D3|nr:hypothetical protein [Candidatus Palauibacter scopulicola]MDE2663843.1 hypothetical protein [Candidatus Palauibacter scopulicola]